ncbi:MAG: hypothetical protein ACI4MA_03745 [Treponema sp.]
MEYIITIRLCSEDIELLKRIKCNFYQDAEVYIKGQPIREKSDILAKQNLLILHKTKADHIDEPSLIKLIANIDFVDIKLKKELIISNISDCDQYGFELSHGFLKILGEKGFSLQISGLFL